MRRTTRLRGAAITCAALVLAAPAAAQEEGVTIDSDAPAAKEYALPHEQARREASGSAEKQTTQGSRDSALFGEGVSPDDERAAASAGASEQSRATPKQNAERTTPPASQTGQAPDGDATTPVTSTAATTDGFGATTALVGGGALALFTIALGGFALRAVRHRADD